MTKEEKLAISRLPELLNARRLEYKIPACVFQHVALFDNVTVWQIADHKDEKVPGSEAGLYMPDVVQKRLEREAPKGIITSAGPKAMDVLRTNALELGCVIRFARHAPWRMPIGQHESKPVELHMMRVAELKSSDDLWLPIAEEKLRLVWDEETNQHMWRDASGKLVRPNDVSAEGYE